MAYIFYFQMFLSHSTPLKSKSDGLVELPFLNNKKIEIAEMKLFLAANPRPQCQSNLEVNYLLTFHITAGLMQRSLESTMSAYFSIL